jgi:hypothetical protein
MLMTINGTLLACFLAKVIFFFVLAGGFYADLIYFMSLAGLAVSLNGETENAGADEWSTVPEMATPKIGGGL